jgi:CHASE2 domain-containing sensor protein
LLIALCLAIATTVLVDWAKTYYLNTEDEEQALDSMMLIRQEQGGVTQVPPITFFNIDLMTYEALQQEEARPLLSRVVIRKMLQATLSQSPELVVVDYDFGFHALKDSEDQDLYQFLQAAGGLLGDKARLDVNPFGAAILLSWSPSKGPYDELVAQSPLLHWAGVRTIEDEGGLTRRISHWDADCSPGKETLMPGVHWLAAAFLKGGSEELGKLQQQFITLLRDSAQACETWLQADALLEVPILVGTDSFVLSGGGLDTRIQYTMGWDLQGESPMVEAIRPDGRVVVGPLLENIVAFATVMAEVPPPPELIQGRVVLIGSAYESARDHFETPLGYVPGTVLLANAIKSFAEFGPITRSSMWQKLLVVVMLTLLAFFYFHFCGKLSFYDPIIFKQIFLLLSLGLWNALGFLLIEGGAWMDVLFPQYAVALYFAREDFIEMKQRLSSMSKHENTEQDLKHGEIENGET